jgi:repressor LexA
VKADTEVVSPLTEKERRFLEFITSYLQESGISPSYPEIKDHFGFKSFNSVQRYLKQLQIKGYLHIPGGNQKRAITVLRAPDAARTALRLALANKQKHAVQETKAPFADRPLRELLSLPLLGKVAAGLPIENINHDEFTEVPPHLVKNAGKSFTLEVKGDSMIGDGIFDGDVLIIEERSIATNGEIVVATIENEATVKRFYLHQGQKIARPQVELRPSNPDLESMWYSPDEVSLRGVVVGLMRKF